MDNISESRDCQVVNCHSCYQLRLCIFDCRNKTRLAGASFQLLNKNRISYHGVSNQCGEVSFSMLSPGCYTLIQTGAPDGYNCCLRSCNVQVTDAGCVSVDGKSENPLCICNYLTADDPGDRTLYKVYMIDFDITDIQILGTRIYEIPAGMDFTDHAREHPGYELISPRKHTFYNIQQEESWFFRFRKI